MTLEDTLAGLPDGEKRRRQAEDVHARRLRELADALAAVNERCRQDLATPEEGIPATPPVQEQLDRLRRQQATLDANLASVRGRYLLQGADAYDWKPEGLHLNYHPLTLAELAKDTYPPGKLMEAVVHFRAGPLEYKAVYYSKGLRLESIGHAEYGDFMQVLDALKKYHRTTHTDGDNIHDIESTTLAAEFTYPLPVTTQLLESLRGFYSQQPREIEAIRVIYEGIAREEFDHAGLPAAKLVKTW